MIKRIVLILIYVLIIRVADGQDQITRISGSVIDCNITSIDTSKIEFLFINSGKSTKTFLAIIDISSFAYNGIVYDLDKIEKWELLSLKQKRDSEDFMFADSIENNNKSFLYTYSNQIISGKIIYHKKTLLEDSYFLIGSKKYSSSIVKFYKNETCFYANTRDVSFSGSSIFAERIRKGRINLYEHETTSSSPTYYSASAGMYTSGISTKKINNYYNKGFVDLKKTSYKNLVYDLDDNIESSIYLKKYKSVRDAQTILYIAGGVTLISGLATLIHKTKDWDGSDSEPEPNVTGSIVAIGLGASCFWVSYFISFSKPKHLRNAIDFYNK